MSLNEAAWVGTAPNISLGGVYMTFDETVSATEDQPIHLCFLTEVGTLEIRGKVRGLHETPGQQIAGKKEPPLGLAVEFEALDTMQEKILASLLEGLHAQSVLVKLMGFLSSQETGDLLLESRSLGTGVVPLMAFHPGPPEVAGGSLSERRLVPRVNLAIPVRLEVNDPLLNNWWEKAVTVDLSVSGARLRLKNREGRPNLLGHHVVLRLSLPQVPTSWRPHMPGDAAECTVTGEIVWTAPDTTDTAESRESSLAPALCLGIRFVSYGKDGLRRIAEVMSHLLTSDDQFDERSDTARVTSSQVECRNAAGQRILAYHDSPQESFPGSPLVIISPGYGATKREYVTLAYHLAENGFQVLRYDHTNHVGESEGDIADTTLTGMKQDLCAVLDFAKQTWPTSPIAVIAFNLSARVALKMASQDHRADLLVLVTGVVDLQATLREVHQEDLIVSFLHGTRRGVINVLGFNVDADRFLKDAIKEGYFNLQTTIQDAQQVHTTVIFFAAEHDPWVRLESVQKVQAALRKHLVRQYLVPEALHRLQENPRKVRAVFRQLVSCCVEYFDPESPQREILEPSQREIDLQSRRERERARARHQMARTEHLEFWHDYLNTVHSIANVPDYWQLLDHIHRLVGRLDGGTRILDAGCGNGDFGMFVLINHAYRQRNSGAVDSNCIRYVGLDFVPSVPAKARDILSKESAEIEGKMRAAILPQPLMEAAFICSDLNAPLPFHDNQFDRIICNLVIGYLEDPAFTLGEFMRVLSPKGRLVITNLKPNADLSQIYRSFVQHTGRPEEVEEARQLLNNFGKIRQAESDGVFRFFDRQELAMLLISSGAVQPSIYSTFANQAYIAVAEKPDAKKESRNVHAILNQIPMDRSPLDEVVGVPHSIACPINPLDEGPMKRVNSHHFYELGAAMCSLPDLTPTTILKDAAPVLMHAQFSLRAFLDDKEISLSFSKSSGEELFATLYGVVPLKNKLPDTEELEKGLGFKVFDIHKKAKKFETVLAAELQNLATYCVSKKSIFDTDALINRAEDIFPEGIKQHLSDQVKLDIREAGKCIAFDLATAAGFHLIRAVESILLKYLVQVTGITPKEAELDWGAYIRMLKENDGDPKVCVVLDQIRDLYRSPEIHPETVLSMDEALTLLGIAQRVIVVMVMDLEKRKATFIPKRPSSYR